MKYTKDIIKCPICLRGNNFLILIKQEKDKEQLYYITQCPKCSHCEECKEISVKDAKYYQSERLLLDGPNAKPN